MQQPYMSHLFVNKLIENTITEAEIESCLQLINTENSTSFNLLSLFNFFSQQALLKNDAFLMKNIYQKFPEFIHQYIKFFIRSSFIFGFDSQYSIDIKFLDVFEIIVNNDIVPLTYIAQQLNTESKLNCFYCNKIVDRFPKLIDLIPETTTQLKKLENSIHQLFTDPKICLPAAWASVKVGDAANPRITKFGGVRPYLPLEGPVKCSKCHDQCCMICQIYVPSTPQWFQDRFPPHNRNILIAAFYCNSCFQSVETRTFTEKELDSIVYINDIVYQGSICYTFNSPRLVLEWTTGSMVPQQCNTLYRTLKRQLFGDDDSKMIIDNYFEYYNYLHGPQCDNMTYLGGYANFVQTDEQPDDAFLVMNLEESTSSPAIFGDAGSAQIFMTNPVDGILGESSGTWASC